MAAHKRSYYHTWVHINLVVRRVPRRETKYRHQIQEHQNTIAKLQHDMHRLNNIINPIPPPVAAEKEDPNILVANDDGMVDVEEESEEEVEPWEDDHGDDMSGVDSANFEP